VGIYIDYVSFIKSGRKQASHFPMGREFKNERESERARSSGRADIIRECARLYRAKNRFLLAGSVSAHAAVTLRVSVRN
jgi:hypothetical protein